MNWIGDSNNRLFNEYNHFKNTFLPLRASLIRPFVSFMAGLPGIRGMHDAAWQRLSRSAPRNGGRC